MNGAYDERTAKLEAFKKKAKEQLKEVENRFKTLNRTLIDKIDSSKDVD